MTPVKSSAAFIASRSTHVTVSLTGVDNAVNNIISAIETGDAPEFGDVSSLWRRSHDLPDETDEAILVDWIFLLDTLNFSFWTDDPEKPYSVSHRGRKFTGYAAMVAAVTRALESGIPITSPSFYKNISMDELRNVLNPDNAQDAPMLPERFTNLNQAGQLLCSKYQGSFVNVVKEANKSAVGLVQLIASLFPHYNDVCEYDGREVSFLKRAQIVVADIWACFDGKNIGEFNDIDDITMFADYRVPQILCAWGVIEYSSELRAKLDRAILIESSSKEECELRGCSIHGVECMVSRLRETISNANAIRVDYFLWNYAKSHNLSHVPIHHTRTVFY